MRKLLLALPVVIFAVFASLAFVGMQREDPEGLPSAIAGQKAPSVRVGRAGRGMCPLHRWI
jgi:cytochrome c biogenesis protein CcmG/thiol:disulfide interchange protein DsbE